MKNRLTRRNLFGLSARSRSGASDPTAFSLESFYEQRAAHGGSGTSSGEIPHFSLREGLPSVETTRIGAGEQEAPLVDKSLPPVHGAPLAQAIRIEQKHCLAWQRSFCSVCSERCPEPGAIVVTSGKPEVDQTACTGCGICVQVCPAPVNAFTTVEQPASVPVREQA